jgi:putative transcriptional regulator
MDEPDSEFTTSLGEALAFMQGEPVPGVRVHHPRNLPDLKALRGRLSMSQEEFARSFGIPLATLRGWEIGRHTPDATATAYLNVIDRIPGPVRAALSDPEAVA